MSYLFRPASFEISPTVDTAAFATGDQVGSVGKYKLENAVWASQDVAVLDKIVVLCKSPAVTPALDLLFWNSEPTIASVENAAFDATDAEVLEKLEGVVSLVAGDFKAIASNNVAVVKDMEQLLKSKKNSANTSGRDLWVSLVARGAITFGSASDLKLRIQFR